MNSEMVESWHAIYHHFTRIACSKKLRGLRQKLDALRVQNGQSLSKTWCHVMAHIFRGKNIVQFGPSFITNHLQIGASLNKKPCGSDRETCSPCCRNVIMASFRHVFSSTGNMELHDIHAEILDLFRVRLAHLYTN